MTVEVKCFLQERNVSETGKGLGHDNSAVGEVFKGSVSKTSPCRIQTGLLTPVWMVLNINLHVVFSTEFLPTVHVKWSEPALIQNLYFDP